MIQEAYVSFETSKLLKEKRFDVACNSCWYGKGKTFVTYKHPMNFYEMKIDVELLSCPTQQMAMRWLREVHGLFISIGNDDLDYNWQIVDVKNRTKDFDPTYLTESYAGYKIYEEACEAAIKYCLEHLI